MSKATRLGGPLNEIPDCKILIPGVPNISSCDEGGSTDGPAIAQSSPSRGGAFEVTFKVLPDISDSKSASYNDEVVIGRASPLKTYSQSDNRSITMQIHLIVSEPCDIEKNYNILRAIQSAVYPREGHGGAPYTPPPVCRMKCGRLLAEEELCVILKSYQVRFPTEVAWDEDTFIPFQFDIDTQWDVVYKSSELPGQNRIFRLGK